MNIAHRFFAHSKTALFLAEETVRSHARNTRKLHILFSKKQDWEAMIAFGFRFTPHTVVFANLQTENFKNYDLVVPLTVDDLKYLDGARARRPQPNPNSQYRQHRALRR